MSDDQRTTPVAITGRPVAYRDLDTQLTGTLYRPDGGTHPGILLVHGGAGLDDHAREQARRYAGEGYAVLACDMFGDGVTGRDRIMSTLLGLRDDPALLVRRARAGLDALRACPEVGEPTAAIGFCFGGMAALALARAGADIAAAVSIHGTLSTTAPATPGAITARILVCHGAADPHVPTADVTAFTEEMNAAGADWTLTMYGGAMHGFTHAHAAPGATPGVAHHPEADGRSFRAVRELLAETLLPEPGEQVVLR